MSVTKLPSMEHTFTISVKGNETRQMFDGTFTYSRPTLGRRLEAAKMESRLKEQMQSLELDISLYVEMISFLRYNLIKFPEWYKESNFGLNLHDINVVTELYNECQKFEEEWSKKVYGDDEKTVEQEKK